MIALVGCSDPASPLPLEQGSPLVTGSTPIATTGRLQAGHSALCVGARGPVAAGSALMQSACSDALQLDIEPISSAVRLRVHGSDLCVALPGGSVKRYARFQLAACSDAASQTFGEIDHGAGSHSYRSTASGLCLDVGSNSREPSAPMVQWDCHLEPNQRFVLIDLAGPVTKAPSPVPPAALASLDEIIADMKQAPTANGRSNNEAAVIFSGNYDQAVKLAPNYAPSFNNIASWCWAFEVQGNRARNTAVEARHHEVYALRKSTGAWQLVDGGRPSGYRGKRSGSTGELSDEVVVDDDTVRVRPGGAPRTDLVSYEMWQPNAARTIDYVRDIDAVFARCEMRIVTLNTAASADIDSAQYAGQVGFDFWRRGAGPFQPGVTQFWGSNGRMKAISKDWKTFNVITLKPRSPQWSNLPGELGFGPAWTVANPYLDPPYTLTEQAIRSTPPPLR